MEKTFRLSRYNVLFERSGRRYLWNTLTGALIGLDDDACSYIERFDGRNDGSSCFAALFDNGCIVDSRFDELGKVLSDERGLMASNHPTAVHYTIAPGLGCNYRCGYCFESGHLSGKSMDGAMQDEVADFIIESAQENGNLRHIGITWFGGEPLLYLGAIERISERVIDYCDRKGISYGASIVSNGRHLTRENAERIAACRISSAQIAVDGTAEAYARLKGASEDDFHRVVSNIEASADLIRISVRINAAGDLDDAMALTDYLLSGRSLDGRIGIYLAHVRDYESALQSDDRESHRRFLAEEGEFMRMFGEGRRYSLESLSLNKPERRCTTCLSVCAPNFCIGPEGELYRCEHHFGQREKVVGTIAAGRFFNEADSAYTATPHLPQCLVCDVFPVCLGGCKNDTVRGEAALHCEDFKSRLIDTLLLGKGICIE